MPKKSTKSKTTNLVKLRQNFIKKMRTLSQYYFVMLGEKTDQDYVTAFTDLLGIPSEKSELKAELLNLIEDRKRLLQQIKHTILIDHPKDNNYVVLTFPNEIVKREIQGLLQLKSSITITPQDNSFTISKSDLEDFCHLSIEKNISTLIQVTRSITTTINKTTQVETRIDTLNATYYRKTTVTENKATFFSEQSSLLEKDQADTKCCDCCIIL